MLSSLSNSPLFGFTILLLVILIVPPIFERLRFPGLVGLLAAGVCLGPDGLGLLDADREMMKLLSDIGKIYLMFVAGLEIDLEDFRKKKDRSLGFGFATFIIPLLLGLMVGRLFGMGWNASILIGSLMASHTLLGYPIINRLGVASNEAVTVTIGATIFTDIAALLVLAICVSVQSGEFTIASLAIQLLILATYGTVVLYGIDRTGREYFRRTGNEESNQFLFVLLAVFLASVGAVLLGIDKIVGAFLAGLAINDVVGRGPVEEKITFVGSTLFIPIFFVAMGLLLDIEALRDSLTTELPLTGAIVVALISAKFLAAAVAKLFYRYTWPETLTMWSLSLPQVAATLAAALAGVNAGIISIEVFNAVIVLMLVTAILGPVLTARYGRNLSIPSIPSTNQLDYLAQFEENSGRPFSVIVPLMELPRERYLIEMGAMLARHESGMVLPLSVTKAQFHLDAPELNQDLDQAEKLLERAAIVTEEYSVNAKPIVRVDDDIAAGICRAAREQKASLIIMGWNTPKGFQARLFGNNSDKVFWSAHCPVAVVRYRHEPSAIHRILVPVKNLTPQALLTVRFAGLLADTNNAELTLLHVDDRQSTKAEIEAYEAQLNQQMEYVAAGVKTIVRVMRHDDPAQVILAASRDCDLVVLRSFRRRTAGGLTVSNVTTEVLEKIECSVVLFGEPYQVTHPSSTTSVSVSPEWEVASQLE